MINKPTTVMAEVEDFIRLFHASDVVITSKARKIFLQVPIGKNLLGLPTHKRLSMADLLAWSMGAYQLFKDDAGNMKEQIAYELLDYIERGRTYGIIKNLNLTNKLNQCQEQNTQLKEEKNKLQKENQRLKRLNKGLNEVLGKFGKAGNVSNVSP